MAKLSLKSIGLNKVNFDILRRYPEEIKPPSVYQQGRKNVFLFVPHGGNIGDRIHYAGLKFVLDKAFPAERFNVFEIYAEVLLSQEMIDEIAEKGDFFIVCGTPWFWAGLHKSFRYHQFGRVLAVMQRAYKIGFGLGSAFLLGEKPVEALSAEDEQLAFGAWAQFNKVYTRDKNSVDILKSLGKESVQLPCSAMLARDYHNVDEKKTDIFSLVFHDIRKSALGSQLKREFVDNILEAQYWFIKEYNPRVFCVSEYDILGYTTLAKYYGVYTLPAPTLWKPIDLYDTRLNEEFLLHALAESGTVVTGRVHAGVPARSFNKKVYILPCDTRSDCVVDVGGVVVLNKDELKNAIFSDKKQPFIDRATILQQYLDACVVGS